MEMQYFKEYSPALGREMECKVYGHGGRPMLYIPCQDGRFFDFEDFHMADTLAPWIESGQLMVISLRWTRRPGRTPMATLTGASAGMSSGCIISWTRLSPAALSVQGAQRLG